MIIMKNTLKSRIIRAIGTCALSLALPFTAVAQTAAPAPMPAAAPFPAQFDITGFIEAATLDTSGAICRANDPLLAGGTVTVNNVTVVIPCNTILQMPATSLTWAELFRQVPAGTRSGETALALRDSLPLKLPYNGALPSYQIRVQGNVISGRYIAGLVLIGQAFGEAVGATGIVNYINYQTGDIHIGGIPNVPAATDTRVRLNDPVGRFGRVQGAIGSGAAVESQDFDARFTADTDNPTVRSETGYPMCVPRIDPYDRTNGGEDPLCPIRNRPLGPTCRSLPAAQFPAFPATAAGQFCRTFAMDAPPVASAGGALAPCLNGICATDPTRQAPIVIGDTVAFKGTLRVDALGAPFISAYELIPNVGIYTQPGVKPAYIGLDVMVVGVGAPATIAGVPQASTTEMRVEGFTTDPSMFVDIYTVDKDPATGREIDRFQGAVTANGGVLGRFRFRANGYAGYPTRTMRVVTRNLCGSDAAPCVMPAQPQRYANDLIAGAYSAPVFDLLFPEAALIGQPMVPANFQDLPFLYCGSGPLQSVSVPAGVTGPMVGQLSPAPWQSPMASPVFAATFCPSAPAVAAGPVVNPVPNPQPAVTAPIANAGNTQTMAAGAAVVLSAAASIDTNVPARALSYSWVQIAGPAVTLSANGATVGFTAPAAPAALQFQLTVSNGLASATATVTVNVNAAAQTQAPVIAFASPAVNAAALASATVNAVVTDPNVPAQAVTLSWRQIQGAAVALTGSNTLAIQFTAPRAPDTLVFELTATNARGQVSTATVRVNVVPDVITVSSAIWTRANGRLTVTAASSVPAAPTQLFASVFAGTTALTAQPVTMQTRKGSVCGAAATCWQATIQTPRVPGTTTFQEPSALVIDSSRGGRLTLTAPGLIIQ